MKQAADAPVCCCQHDLCLGDNLAHNASLPLPILLPELAHLLPHLLAFATSDTVPARPIAQLPLEPLEVLLDVVEQRARIGHARLGIERMARQAGQDTCRMPDAGERDRLGVARVRDRETCKNVVDREVGRAAHEDALPCADALPDDLDERLRLARAGRAPDEGELLAREGKVDRFALGVVQAVVNEGERVFGRPLGNFGLLDAEQDGEERRERLSRGELAEGALKEEDLAGEGSRIGDLDAAGSYLV